MAIAGTATHAHGGGSIWIGPRANVLLFGTGGVGGIAFVARLPEAAAKRGPRGLAWYEPGQLLVFMNSYSNGPWSSSTGTGTLRIS